MTTAVLLFSNALNAHIQRDLSVMDKLKALESNIEERVGVFAINTANDCTIEYRAKEVFPTGCTSKVIGVSAVLKKSMSDPSLLLTNIKYSEEELNEWSPVTRKYVTTGMTIQDLCAASISFSDNTSMNLLLKIIDGVQGMNDFAQSIGDLSFRQDNDWPAEAFSGGVNNLKDSSTPKSMVESLRKLTIGEILDKPQRDLLITWLINTQTGASRIRSAIPNNWVVGNKTGTGAVYGSTNDLAIVWPPNHAPILIGIYYTSNNEHAKKREDIVANATRILIEEFVNDDKTLVHYKKMLK
ncbi:MAG: class A beta-lactamase [Parachlamydiales bacterium]|jgi:beta-lactamase class A